MFKTHDKVIIINNGKYKNMKGEILGVAKLLDTYYYLISLDINNQVNLVFLQEDNISPIEENNEFKLYQKIVYNNKIGLIIKTPIIIIDEIFIWNLYIMKMNYI